MSHGNTTAVFDLILDPEENVKTLHVDITNVVSADSSLSLFLHGLAILSMVESTNVNVRHCYESSSSAYTILKAAGVLSPNLGFEPCII
eukprot:854717-Ditylum_brightwellii.AAC.1